MITHLVVPGLLGDLPRLGELGELPRFPHLEMLLSRADTRPSPRGYAETLFQLFGLAPPEAADLPTAAICYQAENNAEPLAGSFYLHADPVHLRPDQDRLLAFDFHHQPITENQARQFAEAFNAHFAEDGLRLLTPDASRWYLAATRVPDLRTQPLRDVLGRNVDLFLPEGGDARIWRAWMNELQMLFHSMPANQDREAQGQWPVSGLWLSGGGVAPDFEPIGFTAIEGDCLLAAGLQDLSGERQEAGLLLEQAVGRAVCDADPPGWVEAVADLDRRLADCLDEEIHLHPCGGRAWHWKPSMRWRLWRRVSRPFS